MRRRKSHTKATRGSEKLSHNATFARIANEALRPAEIAVSVGDDDSFLVVAIVN